ncbi:hypothetical protein AMS68_005255 [Peltaster fructicola]|uniref:Exonuclease domain-containing protein n=1 Tax=Peltaster fructicola TaxID=286661 RepID=A0A6H0XYR1_9PEZI|nr:hypothetical protein AMS68_005255 [Peltaster fructicola]
MPGVDLTKISSNWKLLQAQLKSEQASKGNDLKRKRRNTDEPAAKTKRIRPDRPLKTKRNATQSMGGYVSSTTPTVDASIASHTDLKKNYDISNNDLSAAYGGFFELSAKDKVNAGRHSKNKAGKYLALDCEMVGTGPPPHSDDVLARVSIVNFHGEQIYDSYVQTIPGIDVEDYRTHVSGIREEHMRPGTARPFAQVQKEIAELLDGRILVGHALKKDLQALQLNIPQRDIRDTSRHKAFRVESRDARATMLLYKKEKTAFEEESRRTYGAKPTPRKSVQPVLLDGSEDESELLDGEEDDDDEEDDPGVDDGMTGSKTKKTRKKKNKKKTKTKR